MPLMAQGFHGERLAFFEACMKIDALSIFYFHKESDFHVQDGDRGIATLDLLCTGTLCAHGLWPKAM